MTDAQMEGLSDWVHGGGALVGIHSATINVNGGQSTTSWSADDLSAIHAFQPHVEPRGRPRSLHHAGH